MNYLEIAGVVFLGLLSLIPAYIVYHVVRGAILAIDYTRWCLWMNRNSTNPQTVTVKIVLTIWYRILFDMIGFNGESGVTAYEAAGSTWRGYGSWRK